MSRLFLPFAGIVFLALLMSSERAAAQGVPRIAVPGPTVTVPPVGGIGTRWQVGPTTLPPMQAPKITPTIPLPKGPMVFPLADPPPGTIFNEKSPRLTPSEVPPPVTSPSHHVEPEPSTPSIAPSVTNSPASSTDEVESYTSLASRAVSVHPGGEPPEDKDDDDESEEGEFNWWIILIVIVAGLVLAKWLRQ
jgi:hypothetical protein